MIIIYTVSKNGLNMIIIFAVRMSISMGVYPSFLVDAWDQWDEEEESDNDRPG